MTENSQYARTTKYIIKAKFDVDGVVEKPDVIGAIFGQTEGLFGPDLDLRELQKTGRIGRIEIILHSKKDHTAGTIEIPSSLDKASTAIIAAAIESVERIGPCNAKVSLEKVEDIREEKRRLILDKAKNILRHWTVEETPSSDEFVKEVSDSVRSKEIIEFGPEKLSAGPELHESGSIIIVEGRADVLNLLRCGIKNTIGLEGTHIPRSIIEISKNKEVTAFLDGDRGGDLILKELAQVTQLDYIARAPPGKEVEELTPKEVMKSLREKRPATEIRVDYRPKPIIEVPDKVKTEATQLRGTLEAIFYDKDWRIIEKLPVGELAQKMNDIAETEALLFDGIITQRILDLAEEKKLKYIIGDRIAEVAKLPLAIKVITISQMLREENREKL
ncbi:DNA primase DnaG [[Eubacterium] cellulosolvens]